MNTKTLNFNSSSLERVNETKFLGVYLDSQLKWHKHIHETTLTIYKKIPILYKLRYIFPLNTLRTLYVSFIHSHITYAITIYGLTYPTTLLPIIAAQNTALRAILFLKRTDSITFAYPLLNILPVKRCIDYHILVLLYKIMYKIVLCPSVKINYQNTTYPLRSVTSKTLTVPKSRTNYGSFTFSHTASQLWNKLPTDLTAQQPFISYKTNLRSFMLASLAS